LNDQTDTDDQTAESAGPPPPPPIGPENEAPDGGNGGRDGSDEKAKADDKLDRDLVKWTKVVAVLTGCLVVAALLQFGAALLQWDAMRNQLTEMRNATPDTKKIVQANQDLAAGMKLQATNTGALVQQASRSAGAAEGSADAAKGQLAQLRDDERPKVSIDNAFAATPLIFDNSGAHIAVTFVMGNSGHSVGENTYPFAAIILSSSKDDVLKALATNCKGVRARTVALDVGAPIYPGVPLKENNVLSVSKSDVNRWQDAVKWWNIDNTKVLSPRIIGCVDFVYNRQHYQTTFIYEIDKLGTGPNPFELIDPSKGNVPAAQIGLAVNPGYAGHSD
jgi:hypothetical protein